MQTIIEWFFFIYCWIALVEYHIIYNCIARWGLQESCSNTQMSNALQLQNTWEILLFWTILMWLPGLAGVKWFVPTELPFRRSLLSYIILKRSLSERCFTTNNTINMRIVLTLYLLYHSFRHHFLNKYMHVSLL